MAPSTRLREVSRQPVTTDRWIGAFAIFAAGVLVLGVQVANPVGVPLYDGVVVQEPYRFLHPPGGSEPGSPTSFASTVDVATPESPQVTAPTLETPPQAQLIALPGAFIVPTGVTTISVSVVPVNPPTVAAGGQIAGNVYRFTVADPNGQQLAIKPCDGCISLVMRAPESLTGDARLQRFADGEWTEIETVHAGILGMYSTNPTVLGDYAIVTGGGGGGGIVEPEQGLAVESYIVVGGAAVILVLFFAAALLLRRRQPPAAAPARARPIPSKRKRPTRPPPGRPDR